MRRAGARPADGRGMSVFDQLIGETQPNYVNAVADGLLYLIKLLGEETFANVGKDEFTDRVLDLLTPGDPALTAMMRLCELSWWSGLHISDDAYGRMGEIAR